MIPDRSRRSRRPLPRAARPITAVPSLLLVAALAGCGGGGAVGEGPAASPPAAPSAPPASAAAQLASGWRYRFTMVSPANDNFAITTRELYLYFRPDTSAVHFQLENRLGVPLKILWDESTFFDIYGRSYRAVHRGVTYATRDLPQEATYVQPGARYSDILIPVELLNDPGAAVGQGARPLLPTDLSAQSLIGRVFGPNLVVEVENEERLVFEARFKIESVYSDR
jgi:hypothetical protein